MKWLKIIGLIIAAVFLSQHNSFASSEEIDVPEIVFGHVLDSYEWHIATIGEKEIAIYLPVIVRSKHSGWQVFSSEKLMQGEYKGLHIAGQGERFEGKIVEKDGTRPFDISITKNVLSLIFSSILLLLIVLLTARWYKKAGAESRTPSGLAAFLEPLVMMIHSMARENIGEKYKRFSPFLCTVFFFILLNNFLGIVPFFPGGANLTGNIAITLVLAIFTFIMVNAFGTKEYYKEMFNPNVPSFLKPIMPVIEVFSALMKPISLTIRLFANILAGHILLLCLVCLIFFVAKYNAVLFGSISVVSVILGVFADLLECLVAFIQAYIFTMLSSIYIGLAQHKE